MKLALGTAQLGMDYGISNRVGKPSFETACALLGEAEKCGIELWDTASGYGDSETIIGQYIGTRKKSGADRGSIHVVTKIPDPANLTSSSIPDIKIRMREQLNQSRNNLKSQCLDYCLLHSPQSMFIRNGLTTSLLQHFKEERLVNKIGVSTYTVTDVERFLELNDLDAIQVPLNIMDFRLLHSGLLEELHARKIEIHVRSIFLQGLLVLPLEQIPTYLNEAVPYLKQLHGLAAELGLSVAQLSLLYVRDIKEISKMVIGCESIEQIQEHAATMKLSALDYGVREEARRLFSKVPEYILNPSHWGRTK